MGTAFLILTTECTRKCPYCFYETGSQPRGEVSRALRVDGRLLSSLKSAGINALIFTGGEPLLLPDLEETVQGATAAGLDTLLLTNGDLLDAPRLEALAKAGLGGLSLSLDGLSEGSSYKAPWDALHLAASSPSLRAAVITPISRLNLKMLPEILSRINALGLYVLLQPVFVPQNHPQFEALSLQAASPEERSRFLELIGEWSSLHGNTGYGRLIQGFYESKGGIRPPACSMGTGTVVIDSNGDVMPCFHRRDLCVGNLHQADPSRLIKSSFEKGECLRAAPCFGEHCISLFSHL